ncbi:MAG: PQQ-binding-like beta-propeller repeat protein, partial [bacterium]|nr:PQQ-binding-like beta-propeller repeat protein [bacterium]
MLHHGMPPEVIDLMTAHWNDVFLELGPSLKPSPEMPLDVEAMVGQTLARVRLISENHYGEEWLDAHFNKRNLAPDFHRIVEQYQVGLNHGKTAKAFWESIPPEIRNYILAESDTSNPEAIPYSPILMAQALAQACYQSRLPQSREVRDAQGRSTRESMGDWILKKIEISQSDLEELLRRPRLPGTPSPFLQEFLFHWHQFIAHETRRNIFTGLGKFLPDLEEAILQEKENLRGELTNYMPHTSSTHREIRALGMAVGMMLERVYLGVLQYGRERKFFRPEEMGVSSHSLDPWTERAMDAESLDSFIESLSEQPDAIFEYGYFVEWIQLLRQQWGDSHPMILGIQDTFRAGRRVFPLERRLEQTLQGIHLIEHAPAKELMRGLHPEFSGWVHNNLRFVPLPVAEDPTHSLARALAVSLAQSNGVLPFSSRPIFEFAFDLNMQPPPRILYLPQPSEMAPSQARDFQKWFRVLMNQVHGEKSLLDFSHYLYRELGEVSGQKILASTEALPPAVYEGTVYFGSKDGHLYALDVLTGTEKWRFIVNEPIDSSPAV